MQRREFIATVAALGTLNACQSVPLRAADAGPAQLPDCGDALNAQMNALLAWLHDETPWSAYLGARLGVTLPARLETGPAPHLLRIYTSVELNRIRNVPGFEDFGGQRLIEPGKPALSLLYFALASPRVQLPADSAPTHYATLAQLDALENYIYAAQPAAALDLTNGQYVLAVFSYEFRPGAKTPHRKHADMVYSRTGISRVGNACHVWDRQHRRFRNTTENPQDVAVTPARFGVFLAQVATYDQTQVIGKNVGDWRQQFLLPVRKLTNDDPLLGGRNLSFSQYHRDEKLARLLSMRGLKGQPIRLPARVGFQCTQPPFLRVTCTSTSAVPLPFTTDNTSGTEQQLVSLITTGSSVLLEPQAAPMVREAVQHINGVRERLRFRVPEFASVIRAELSNRRYTTLKLIENPAREAAAFYADDILYGGGRKTTSFLAPRNGPTFVNIRYKVSEHDGNNVTHLGPGCGIDDWEDIIYAGGYWAALFQDNLCDGCISANLSGNAASTSALDGLLAQPILPGFSLVSPPDFLQLVDGIDLEHYDNHFLEGGTEVVSGARVRANPHLLLPGTDTPAFPLHYGEEARLAGATAFTVTAVVSATPALQVSDCRSPRDYASTNSLPDTASNVFAPGWDITYADIGSDARNFYFASFGLGSPFPEDMKLCAAANGMWPAASPDAARTFYPSLGEVVISLGRALTKRGGRRPPTAVPLLDQEIGLHQDSPAVHHYQCTSSPGWDGEYGPFLIVQRASNRISINFTDVGRADYVENLFTANNQMRVGALQSLNADELIRRMAALKTCIDALPHELFLRNHVRLSKLWLVSAEAVQDWHKGASGHGLPKNMFGTDNRWATVSHLGVGAQSGLLFIFATELGEHAPISPDSTRSLVNCGKLFICQLAHTGPGPDGWRLAWTSVTNLRDAAPQRADWRQYT